MGKIGNFRLVLGTSLFLILSVQSNESYPKPFKNNDTIFDVPAKEIEKFTFAKVFKDIDNCTDNQYHSYTFKMWLANESKDDVISISKAKKLNYFYLPEKINCNDMKGLMSKVMSLERFKATFYLLVVRQELSKNLLGFEISKDSQCYFLNVRLNSGMVRSFFVIWDGTEWYISMRRINGDVWWNKGVVFLY